MGISPDDDEMQIPDEPDHVEPYNPFAIMAEMSGFNDEAKGGYDEENSIFDEYDNEDNEELHELYYDSDE